MKDVLLLHDNARPHTSLGTREAIAKIRWTVPPQPAHSPDLAPSDYRLFGPVKDAILKLATNSNNVLVMGSEGEARDFTALVYSVLLKVGKSVLRTKQTLWKNSLIIAEDV
jgi:hypothetical protein